MAIVGNRECAALICGIQRQARDRQRLPCIRQIDVISHNVKPIVLRALGHVHFVTNGDGRIVLSVDGHGHRSGGFSTTGFGNGVSKRVRAEVIGRWRVGNVILVGADPDGTAGVGLGDTLDSQLPAFGGLVVCQHLDRLCPRIFVYGSFIVYRCRPSTLQHRHHGYCVGSTAVAIADRVVDVLLANESGRGSIVNARAARNDLRGTALVGIYQSHHLQLLALVWSDRIVVCYIQEVVLAVLVDGKRVVHCRGIVVLQMNLHLHRSGAGRLTVADRVSELLYAEEVRRWGVAHLLST